MFGHNVIKTPKSGEGKCPQAPSIPSPLQIQGCSKVVDPGWVNIRNIAGTKIEKAVFSFRQKKISKQKTCAVFENE